VNKPKLK